MLLFLQITFNASYTNPPPFTLHPTETVYIAANIIDGKLINGSWGGSLLDLIDAIGKERVFVSIYGGPTAALKEFASKLECESSIVSEEEEPIPLDKIPHTKLPTGESRIKRIAYLAEVRNKALEPLEQQANKGKIYDRVLFINDIYFTPTDALRLLWGTNVSPSGTSEYKAVCAADFVTSWKYYDTYGTRDSEGYSIGVPIFPWFANEGDAESRRDVLAGKDAVRVKSCWGGMVAFDGRYFVSGDETGSKPEKLTRDAVGPPTLPLRFRSEPDPFWDASECCLIHADIMALPSFPSSSSISAQSIQDSTSSKDEGIYMNPYVRVTYDSSSQSRIWIVKRFERLFALPQAIINIFAHMPRFNYRRTEKEGEIVKDKVWVSNINPESPTSSNFKDGTFATSAEKISGGVKFKRATLGGDKLKGKDYWKAQGYYKDVERVAERGGYCGVRQLLVLKENRGEGEGNWDNLLDLMPPLNV